MISTLDATLPPTYRALRSYYQDMLERLVVGPLARDIAATIATGSAGCVSAGQNRPDDPQDREDEANEAKDPMAFAEAENCEDDQQNKVDDA